MNTTDTEYIFEGLKPDTQYEFIVKLANSKIWSLTVTNRTLPSPPSSPPRDLTIIGPQSEKDDPTLITINWQPPKYANGEIRGNKKIHYENQKSNFYLRIYFVLHGQFEFT